MLSSMASISFCKLSKPLLDVLKAGGGPDGRTCEYCGLRSSALAGSDLALGDTSSKRPS